MKIVIDTEKSVAPEGFELTGEYRKSELGEYFLSGCEAVLFGKGNLLPDEHNPILKKKPPQFSFDNLQVHKYADDYFRVTIFFKTDEENANIAGEKILAALSDYQEELSQ